MCILILLKGYLDAYLLESKHVRFICCTIKIIQIKSVSVVLCVRTDSITVQKAITILFQLIFWSNNHISLTWLYCVTFIFMVDLVLFQWIFAVVSSTWI